MKTMDLHTTNFFRPPCNNSLGRMPSSPRRPRWHLLPPEVFLYANKYLLQGAKVFLSPVKIFLRGAEGLLRLVKELLCRVVVFLSYAKSLLCCAEVLLCRAEYLLCPITARLSPGIWVRAKGYNKTFAKWVMEGGKKMVYTIL